jgi:uncharacterized DUF497 family protein
MVAANPPARNVLAVCQKQCATRDDPEFGVVEPERIDDATRVLACDTCFPCTEAAMASGDTHFGTKPTRIPPYRVSFLRDSVRRACVTTSCNYNTEVVGVIFEWDERKRRRNVTKHGLDFADCAAIFEGPCVTVPDNRFDYDDSRLWTYGLLKGRVVLVVYTECEQLIRVISMRKATPYEEAKYLENFQD